MTSTPATPLVRNSDRQPDPRRGRQRARPPALDASPSALDALVSIDLLRSCSRRVLRDLLPHSDVIAVPSGLVVERIDARARQFLGIVDGFVEAVDDAGRSMLLGPGDQIGAVELVAERYFEMTYTTVTPTVFVAVFGPAFRSGTRAFLGAFPPQAEDATSDFELLHDRFQQAIA